MRLRLGATTSGPLWELILDDAERARYRGLIVAQVLCGAGEYDWRVVSVCNKFPLALVVLVKRILTSRAPFASTCPSSLPKLSPWAT